MFQDWQLNAQAPVPHDVFNLFPDRLLGRHLLQYVRDGVGLRLGKIGDKADSATSADQARANIEATYPGDGPILHLALAPHSTHNVVHVLDELPDTHTTLVGDAIIVRRQPGQPFAIETLLGDCACIITVSSYHTGFIHCGTPELFEEYNILRNFRDTWLDLCLGEDTSIFLGPCISGRNYQYGADSVPERYKGFVIKCDGEQTVWGEGNTFGLEEAIAAELLSWWLIPQFDRAEVDPFGMNVSGNHNWASDRYYKFQASRGNNIGLSPRDMAKYNFGPA